MPPGSKGRSRRRGQAAGRTRCKQDQYHESTTDGAEEAVRTNLEFALVGISASCEVIGGGLTGQVRITQIDEVLASLVSGTEEDLSARIDDEDFVKLLIDTLTGLVEGDEAGGLEDVCHDAKRLGVVEGGGGIETLRTVVPGSDGRSSGDHLGDGYSLSLTTRDTSDLSVTDEGVAGVGNVEHPEQQAEYFLFELLDRLLRHPLAWGLEGECEAEGLTDGEGGKVDVVCGLQSQGC